MQKYTSLFWC